MRFALKAVVVLLVALINVAAAQSPPPPVIDFGLRGGVLVTDAFQRDQASRTPFGNPTVGFANPRGTLGPAISLLLYDRGEVRFEAVRRRFSNRSQFDLVIPNSVEQHSSTLTQGHSWEYPLFGTYHFGRGATRPFAGGGLSLGGSVHFVTDSQSTTIFPFPSASSQHRTGDASMGTAYYVVGGVEGRTSYLSIRPELRYRRSSDNGGFGNAVEKRNQFEFVLGISVHPLRLK